MEFKEKIDCVNRDSLSFQSLSITSKLKESTPISYKMKWFWKKSSRFIQGKKNRSTIGNLNLKISNHGWRKDMKPIHKSKDTIKSLFNIESTFSFVSSNKRKTHRT